MSETASGARRPPSERGASRRLAFERLSVRRMPGFEAGGFTLEGLSPGVNLVHGPNASGKTTAGRALHLLLWPRSGAGDASLAAVLDLDGERWEVDLDRDRLRHRREGAPAEAPPVPPADAADRYALALHDLLRPDARGADLAAAVAREAAGGYDLEAAREVVGARPRPRNPKKPRSEYEAAAVRVREVEEEQRRIEGEARSLDRLEAELREAREAQARLERIEAALEWVRCRERLARAEEELGGFPAAMERLSGQEQERLEEYRERLAKAREDRKRAVAVREEEASRLASAALPDAGLPDGFLDELGERRERLTSLEREIEQGERERARAQRVRDEARGELGADAVDEDRWAAVEPGDWRQVLDLARRGETLRSQELEIEALEIWVGEAAPVPELDRRLDELGTEARILRDWLREPAGAWRARLPALVAAVLLAALAVAGGLLVHPWIWALTSAAVTVVLWSWLEMRRQAGARGALEEQHRRLAAAEPLAWRPDSVAARLQEVEECVVAARAERQRSERRVEIDARRKRLAAQGEALAEERRDLLARVGLAPKPGAGDAAPLAATVQALCRWREAKDGVVAAEAALEEARRQHARGMDAVRRKLEPYGEASEIADAASVRGAVEALEHRSQAHGRAREALARAVADLARADEEIERAATSVRDLFARLDLADGDDAALADLVARLEAYKAAAEACREAGTELRLAEAKVQDGEELRDRDPAELEAERDEAAERAGQLEELAARRGRVRAEVDRAKRQHDLEHALARLEAKEEELRAEREREADAVAAWVLTEWVRERTRGVQRPAVMARAAALFARITGGAYRLLDPVGDPPVFRAEDTRTGATRELSELSSGRRLQLLVAVRMGFVEELERGVRVPLVMDETLANSDDASATALIEAVLELAREGRQVFYLTAQDDEVAKWRSALEGAAEGPEWRVLDLGAIRRLEDERHAPRRHWQPRRRQVPEPRGLGRVEYAARLRVPGLDPWGEPGAVHLWYLVEEVDVLHGLLVQGLECWGQLEALTVDAGAELLDAGPDHDLRRGRVVARARCLRFLFRAWRTGRGRPVDRSVLAASGAVSERFLDEVSDLAESVGGDPAALLEGLEGGEVKGFRSDKTAQLAGFLRDEGHLDEREVLSRAELREAVLAELAAEIEVGELTPDAVDELLAQMPV